MRETIKTILGLDNGSKNSLIDILIEINTNKVVSYLEVDELPDTLKFVVIELTVERFNRLGSEGVTSESIEGISYNYEPTEKELERYMPYIRNANNEVKGVGKFKVI